MDLTPCPFVLRTSRMGHEEIVPVELSQTKSKNKRLIVCNIKGLNYVNVDASLKERNFATVVYNKRTKEVRTMFNLPEFLTVQIDEEVIDEVHHRAENIDRHCLTNAYGSLRAKRYLKDLAQAEANSQAARDADILQKKITLTSKIKKESEGVADVGNQADPNQESLTLEQRLLPPYDQTTSFVRQIYPIDKLIPASVTKSLAEEAQELSNSDETLRRRWCQEARYPGFIIDRLAFLPPDGVNSPERPKPAGKRKWKSDGSPLSRLQVATNLALLGHMFSLLNLKPRMLQNRTPLPNTPRATVAYLLNEFTATVDRKRIITPLLRDKLLFHIFVLILHCDNFATCLDKQLPVDFKLSTDKLKKHFTFIGCSFSRTAAERDPDTDKANSKKYLTVARLTAPLKLKDKRSAN